jgi:hypothetical protein
MESLKVFIISASCCIPPPPKKTLSPHTSSINREDITIINFVKNIWADAYMGMGGILLDEKRHSSRLT